MLKDTFTFQGPLGEIECVVEPNRSENNAVLVMAHGFRGSRDSGDALQEWRSRLLHTLP